MLDAEVNHHFRGGNYAVGVTPFQQRLHQAYRESGLMVGGSRAGSDLVLFSPARSIMLDFAGKQGLRSPHRPDVPGGEREMKTAVMTGRCADGAERGKGRLTHWVSNATAYDAQHHGGSWKAATCGARPGRLSAGWAVCEPGEPTCPRCRGKYLATQREAA